MKQIRFLSSTYGRVCRWLALLAVLLGSALTLPAVTTNYFTGFEPGDGFTAGSPLVGQGGWQGYIYSSNNLALAGSAGNGVVSYIPGLGQQGYVGQTALGGAYGMLDAWYSIGFNPVSAGRPIVKLSATMEIVDSTNGEWDDFYWRGFNIDGYSLFTLDFDNYYGAIFYASAGTTNTYLWTSNYFANATNYTVVITMDFSSNVWSAALNGTALFPPTQMAATNLAMTLDSVDTMWDGRYSLYVDGMAGNNYMLFDNFLITSEAAALPPPGRPTLSVLSASSGGSTTLHLAGQEGYKFAIDASTNLTSSVNWMPRTTNTVSGGFFNFIDTAAASLRSCNCRARWVP